MGTPREVVAGGRVYTVVDDLAVEHRLAVRGVVKDAGTNLPLAVPARVRPLHPRAFAVVRPGAEYLAAVAADPPAVIRLAFGAPGYRDKTVAVPVPAAGAVTTLDVSLTLA